MRSRDLRCVANKGHRVDAVILVADEQEVRRVLPFAVNFSVSIGAYGLAVERSHFLWRVTGFQSRKMRNINLADHNPVLPVSYADGQKSQQQTHHNRNTCPFPSPDSPVPRLLLRVKPEALT